MLVFDACGIKNWHGPGYRCPLKNSKTEAPSTSYYVMLRHPEVYTAEEHTSKCFQFLTFRLINREQPNRSA